MVVRQTPNRFKGAIQQPHSTVHRSWREEARETRRRIAAAQQERLFNVLFPRRASLRAPIVKAPVAESTEELARRYVSESRSYATCFRDISFDHTDGVLTMRGRLPSFYAKQVLQTLLRDLDGVERIDNQTDVVSDTGLSSVRSH